MAGGKVRREGGGGQVRMMLAHTSICGASEYLCLGVDLPTLQTTQTPAAENACRSEYGARGPWKMSNRVGEERATHVSINI